MTHIYLQANNTPVAVANIFCIGRNYAAHAAEMNSPTVESPMIFLKPTSAITTEQQPILLPPFSTDVHYETELVILIGKGGNNISQEDAMKHIAAYGIGLDLTARDIQAQAKSKGHPWTLAKGFRGAACVSRFISSRELADSQNCLFTMTLNGSIKQQGNTALMLFSISYLIHYISTIYGLTEGDLIFTGTPEGVGSLTSGDKITLRLENVLNAEFIVQ